MKLQHHAELTAFLIAQLTCVAWAGTASEKTLYEQSIQNTKQSIARDTLDVFYHDAVDYMHNNQNAEALELLDKIYSIDPTYRDVARLRESIHKSQESRVLDSTRDSVRQLNKQGDRALAAGQSAQAISFWRQSLALDPANAAAQKKIKDTNRALAQKQFEAGYIHYHHGEMEDALDAWSNAIALDPTLRERGLLLLMSKIDRQLQKDQVNRLAAQGFEQSQQGMLEAALKSYTDLLALDPRHEEAKRMSTKLKIQLGRAAFTEASQSASSAHYEDAIAHWEKSIEYGYEVPRSQKSIEDTKARIKRAEDAAYAAKHKPKPPPVVAASSAPAVSTPTAPAPAVAIDPAGAMDHYRLGLAAIRGKDFHQAVTELDAAYQLDSTNERIYMARERAHQEWASVSSGNAGTSTP